MTEMKTVFRLLACCAVLSGATARANNDYFAQATDLNSVTQPYITYVGGTGTAEPGEPPHAGSPAANSHWFTWKATSTTACIFREFVNGNSSRIAIYTGDSLATLTLVAEGRQRVFFPVTDGTVYHIAIDSTATDVIQFKPYPVGGADKMTNADAITGDFPQMVRGNNALATAAKDDEDWHPEFHPTATVWWVWTAPSNGAIRMDARYSDFGLRLTTYERAPGENPVRVSSGYETTGMTVTAGNDYLFCVDSIGDPGQIGFWMEWFPTTPPPNDHIANATDLGSPLIACAGEWIHYATVEPTAPNEQNNPWYPERTLWWKWTAPVTSAYRFSQHGSDGNSSINIYASTTPTTGNIITGLEERDGVRISVTAGTTYWIQIIDWRHFSYRAEINIHPAHTETNYFSYFANKGIFRLQGSQRHPNATPTPIRMVTGFPTSSNSPAPPTPRFMTSRTRIVRNSSLTERAGDSAGPRTPATPAPPLQTRSSSPRKPQQHWTPPGPLHPGSAKPGAGNISPSLPAPRHSPGWNSTTPTGFRDREGGVFPQVPFHFRIVEEF